MKYLMSFFLIILTACPALQTRNEIKSRDGRLGSASGEPVEAKKAAEEQELYSEVRRLNGLVEELSFKIEQLEQKADTTTLENRLDRLEDKVLSYGESLILLDKKIDGKASGGASLSNAVKNAGPYEKAENYFGNSKWKDAILEYNKYRDNFPKGKNYADATYKIGVSFQEMGMKNEARSFYSEVIEKFPQSKAAKSAKFRLNQIKN